MYNRKIFEGRMDDCREMLRNPDELKKLPLLNSTPDNQLYDGQLVRFQGMIQDMFNPVVFFSAYEVKNMRTGETQVRHGDYFDRVELQDDEVVLFDSPKTIPKDRKPYYCVSIPGLNEWVEEHHKIQQRDVLDKLQQQQILVQPGSSDMKRCNCDDQSEDLETTSDGPNKRLCCDRISNDESEMKSDSKSNIQIHSLHLPIENSRGKACMVNIYGEEQYKLNTVIEVAGFLSLDPTEFIDDNCDDEVVKSIPPVSVVPHLHAVAVNKIKHSNPLISPTTDLDEVIKSAESIRAELSSVLKKIMFGDNLAADYLLCYLLSSVFSRQNGLVLGKFSLNVSNVPKDCDYAKLLYTFLSNLIPKSHYLPLTIENLNSMTFVPKKSYETNKLQSGLLQLSDNTFLVLDETKLEPGKLEDKGVKNIQALSKVITQQEIHYDFHYYPLEFTTDIPVLVLSEGKSMLPFDFHIVLNNKDVYSSEFVSELFREATHFLKKSDLMDKFRIYLSTMASLAYKFSEDLQAQIAEDFVRMRQNIGTTTPQDLHDLLVLARLFSISRGCTSLTMQTWEIVQEMELQRKRLLSH